MITEENFKNQIRFLNEQIGYLQQALAFEVADGRKARNEIEALRQEVTLLRRLVKLEEATNKESLTVEATTEDCSVDHFRGVAKKIEEAQP